MRDWIVAAGVALTLLIGCLLWSLTSRNLGGKFMVILGLANGLELAAVYLYHGSKDAQSVVAFVWGFGGFVGISGLAMVLSMVSYMRDFVSGFLLCIPVGLLLYQVLTIETAMKQPHLFSYWIAVAAIAAFVALTVLVFTGRERTTIFDDDKDMLESDY